MKKLFLGVCIALAPLSSAFAFNDVEESITAPGMVKYVMPSGELVSREVSLQVPARGQGEIVLKGGEQQVATTKFRTKKAHGRTIFAVAFDNPPGAPEGSTAVFTGTYMRGTNQAIYYGDVYLVTKTDSASDVIEDAWRGRGVTHKAGFYFEAATR